MVLNHGILDESDVADFVVYIGLGNSLHKLLHLLFILIFNLSLFFFFFFFGSSYFKADAAQNV